MKRHFQRAYNNKKIRGIVTKVFIIAILAGIILPPVLAIFSVFITQ
jgi:hypothetical protein